MLVTLATVVLYFAQGAPDAAQAAAPPASQAAPTPAEAAAGKTVSPVTVTPKPIPPPQIAQKTVTCHEEVVLGSHFPKKVCATQTEFSERRAQDQEQLREWTRLKPYQSN